VNVDAMLRSITARQLMEWMEYDRAEPFGPKRDDLRVAGVAAALMNYDRAKNMRRSRVKGALAPKTPPPVEAADVVMLFGDEAAEAARKKKQKPWQDMKAVAMAYIQTLPTEPPKD
jgi:hypothetical protein